MYAKHAKLEGPLPEGIPSGKDTERCRAHVYPPGVYEAHLISATRSDIKPRNAGCP